jgi:hypothetical protein
MVRFKTVLLDNAFFTVGRSGFLVGSGIVSDCRPLPDCGAIFASGLDTGCISVSDGDTEIGLETCAGSGADSDGNTSGPIADRGSEKLDI